MYILYNYRLTMVYKTVCIVLGYRISREDLENLADFDYDGPDMECFSDLRCGLKIDSFTFPCCHGDGKPQEYILGFVVHTYYRFHTRCSECESSNFVCDACLGTTNNGYYDVTKIADEMPEVNIRNICFHCYSDNREDLGAPLTTARVVDHEYQEIEGLQLKHCKTCNLLPHKYRSPSDVLIQYYRGEQLCAELKKCGQKNIKRADIKLYYVVDDCLLCTG